MQLFGGEPAMRDDLFDIIRLAKERKLTVRIVTNGIKLADEDCCEQIIKTGSTVLMAYDGNNPETDQIDHVLTCAWGQHKTDTMRRIADYYAKPERLRVMMQSL